MLRPVCIKEREADHAYARSALAILIMRVIGLREPMRKERKPVARVKMLSVSLKHNRDQDKRAFDKALKKTK